MKTTNRIPKPNWLLQPAAAFPRRRPRTLQVAALFVAFAFLLFGTTQARAQGTPPGCVGSAIGISLFGSAADVHVGDQLLYSASVFNGLVGNPTSCDASNITASITTPDGAVHELTLRRTYLMHTQSDFYTNVVSYIVRQQDIRPDGTVRATGEVTAKILQNDVPSDGGANQGLNTQVVRPCIQILAQCVGGVGENGLITITGTVTNCGNATLVGVTVTNFVNGGAFLILSPTNLAPGGIASFTTSYVPLNPCVPSTAMLFTSGRDAFTFTPQTVTASTSTTCSDELIAGIKVTKACPVSPTAPGQLLTFSGSVSNTGNVTLTNIVVVNNQPVANTPVFTRASLAPGEVVSFTGSYIAPTNCSVSDTLTASASSRCGVPVSDTASATCPIVTTSGIMVTEFCPETPAVPGGSSSYSGVVRNTGDITLNNVTVVSDRPAPNTVVLTVASLAPGASANYSGSFIVPLDVCTVTTTVRASGSDSCTSAGVTNTASATCPITTAPAIAVTLACPIVQSTNGGLITYTGTVRNSGNVTLNNILVTDIQSSPSTVFTAASLAPGASANFTASFIAPGNTCSVSSTVNASGTDNCSLVVVSNSASATCTLLTNPRIVVTQNCSEGPVSPGGVLTYTGTVRNAGDVTLTNIVVTNDRTGATPVFTVAVLLSGASANFTGSYTVPAGTDCSISSTVTARGSDNCSGFVVTDAASATCSVAGTPLIAVTLNCPATPVVTGESITLSGTVSNPGNVALINVTVVNNQASPSTVLSLANLAPGASANFTATFISPSNACSVFSTVTARGSNDCAGVVATANASTTCTLLTAPAIVVTQNCPAIPVTAGGVLTYSGSVRNAGNITLTNVVVVNSQTGTNVIYTALALLPGAVSNFTGSYTVPADTLCSVSSIVTATGQEICAGNTLTNTAAATCTLATAPAIAVTLNCPEGATAPGAVITYSGTVRNSGNITLNNVTVVNSQASPSTVLTLASLAPGATANFTASFTTPLDACAVTSSVVARGTDACTSAAVTNSASATCPIGTAPSIDITENCPATPVGPGGTLTFSGTVRNSGNITLTNVIVTSDRTGANPILTVATLTPGATANYTGSYVVPADNACSITTVVTVSGNDSCSGIAAGNTASVTCPIVGTPRIVVTQTCPPVQVSPGETLTYSGTVSNSGNVTLTNVVVTNDRSGATPVFSIASLAPRATANFTGSYVTHSDCCVDSSTVTATGRDCNDTLARDTDTRTCSLLTRPGIAVTVVCSPEMWKPLEPGSVLTYSGIVSNSGNITLTNVTIVNNTPTNGSPVFGPITLAAGESSAYTASFVVPVDFCGTHTVTARGIDSCTLLPLTSSATTTCPITTTPSITVMKNCPALPTPYGGTFSYSGSVSNSGNVSLTNVFVVNDQPAPNTPVLGPITLAPGASTNFSGSYPAPTECCIVTDTLTAHGQDSCAGTLVTDTATQICPLLTTPRIFVEENCPATPVEIGSLYEITGSVTNTGDVVLTNVYVVSSHPVPNTVVLGPIELAPGESEGFYGAFIVAAASPQVIVTAAGLDACQARVVSAAANCSGPINPPNEPRAITVTITGNGTVTGVANGQILNIGQSYTATATPAAGSSFLNWSGGVASPSPVLTFVMQSNLVLTANFVFNGSNVFNPVAGTFNGLFFDTNDVQISGSGCFSLTLTNNGSYKATILNKGKKYKVKGTFNANGQAQNTINRAGTNPLVVNWQALLNDSDYLSGNVTDGEAVAQLAGGRDVFNAGNPAPQAGQYTLIIPGIVDSTVSPAGDGYGTVTVDAEGVVRLKGKLADGVMANQNVALSRNGEWPVCISLHGGKGILIGWLQFVDDAAKGIASPGNDIAGTLRWIKPAIATGKLYKQGFSVNSDAIGSHYVPPTGTDNMLQITDGVVVLNGGNLPFSIDPVTFGPSSKLVNNGPNTLKLTFTPSSGLFSGTFTKAGTSKTYNIKGAVLQRQNYGSGYAPGSDQSGRVVFQATSPE